MRRLLLFIALFPIAISAQNIRVLPISADYAVFAYNDSMAYAEVYVSFFRGSLQYQEKADSLMASFESACLISDPETADSLDFKLHRYRNTVPRYDSTRTISQFVDVFTFVLPYGKKYDGLVRISDLNASVQSEYELKLDIPEKAEQFTLSTIELASKISRDASSSIYTKNGLRVIPNPRNSFEIFQPMLYYYLELNKLSFDEQSQNTYAVNYYVTNADGDTLKQGNVKEKKIMGPTMVEVGGFNAMALPRGFYFLNVAATDMQSGIADTARKRFFVYKVEQQDTSQQSQKAEVFAIYQGMKQEELEKEFSMARYISSRDEEQVFNSLNEAESMRRFLTEFWRKRDQQENRPTGMTRRQYLGLAEEAERRFSSTFRTGWKSDRGRVLMVYGRPSEVQSYPNSSDFLPYEIWQYYNLEGGAHFVFCDRTGFGQYELIHSTYHRELSNPSWQSIVNKNSGKTPFKDF